jgi:hypothetical protein
MPISVSGTTITFNDSTTQTTAFTGGGVTSLNGQTGAITNTSFNAIGSYVIASTSSSTSTSIGTTYAGSSLRRPGSSGFDTLSTLTDNGASPASISASGTWRALSFANTTGYGSGVFSYLLLVRVS